MAIREQNKEYDIQTTIYSLLNSLTASPWDRWEIAVGWPDLTTPGDSTSKVSASFDSTRFILAEINLTENNKNGKESTIDEFIETTQVIPLITRKDEYLWFRSILTDKILLSKEMEGIQKNSILNARDEAINLLHQKVGN